MKEVFGVVLLNKFPKPIYFNSYYIYSLYLLSSTTSPSSSSPSVSIYNVIIVIFTFLSTSFEEKFKTWFLFLFRRRSLVLTRTIVGWVFVTVTCWIFFIVKLTWRSMSWFIYLKSSKGTLLSNVLLVIVVNAEVASYAFFMLASSFGEFFLPVCFASQPFVVTWSKQCLLSTLVLGLIVLHVCLR